MAIPFFLVAVAFLVINVHAADQPLVGPVGEPGPNKPKPNFIFIMTDDQDLLLDSLSYQPMVKKHFIDKGTSFKKHFCTIALCCPSRVSLLTGKAAHNTNVTALSPVRDSSAIPLSVLGNRRVALNADFRSPSPMVSSMTAEPGHISLASENHPPTHSRTYAGGYSKFIAEGLNDKYLPVWLQDAGYNTYYTGKFMNGQTLSTYNKPFAAGWTRSDFLIEPNTYYYCNASMALDNGPVQFQTGKYSTDLIANRSVEFLGNAIEAGKPFFLGVMPVGPHSETTFGKTGAVRFGSPRPADRHKDLFPDVVIPRGPSFNPDTIRPGAVGYFTRLPALSKGQMRYVDKFYRKRLQSLQAVDDLVSDIMTKLEAHPDVLANTYLFYTSDNGYHIGQHRLPPGKTCNIEEDINIPFIARGPGIAAGKAVSFPSSHTDVVPTLFELAGIPLHDDFDGEPIPLTTASQGSKKLKQEHINVEFWGHGIVEGRVFSRATRLIMDPNTYKTVRVVSDDYDLSYSVWCTNDHELYDIKADPNQLQNLYGHQGTISGFRIPQISARLDALLLTLKSCKGKACRRPWEEMFPSGTVRSLGDALAPKYDEFFLKTQAKVTFSKCLNGYITSAEGALKPLVYGNRTNVSGMAIEARWGVFD
ncbi:arylsulfatase precursor [Drechmeria coniospora]|uniref:Arylsulfatase n=1 Tax=Drechmeria coniospora TaxID=98403 RepID=A0A151GJ08_DRECN|nr:arylsulfatase precursor [Drechmeria coniospora]KYK57012.1 arylsulfatase precursor [Drechmeria coniospora]